MKIIANPTKKPILVHFFALLLACTASSYLPSVKRVLTFDAFIMPAIPKGRQQNRVTRIDSAIHVFGQMFVFILL